MRIRALALLITLALGLLATALPTEAQQTQIPRIGYLGQRTAPGTNENAFLKGLRDLGWIEGQNIAIEYRWAKLRVKDLPALAAELVRLKVDVIVTHGTPAVQAAKDATTTIPIVMAVAADAVEKGFVASLAHPGGNVTGLTEQVDALDGKLLEMHQEISPSKPVAFLWDPIFHLPRFTAAQAKAQSLGLDLQSLQVRSPEELDTTLEAAVRERIGALLIPNPIYRRYGQQLAEFATKNRVGLLSNSGARVEKYSGLIGYGPNFPDLYRRAAWYVDKIIKGTKPADLPVERPKKFDLVINLKTAKAIGLTIPPTLLFQATKVIQ